MELRVGLDASRLSAEWAVDPFTGDSCRGRGTFACFRYDSGILLEII